MQRKRQAVLIDAIQVILMYLLEFCCSGLAGVGADGGGLWLLAFGSFAALVGASAVFIAGSFLLFSVVEGGWAFSFTTWKSFPQTLTKLWRYPKT